MQHKNAEQKNEKEQKKYLWTHFFVFFFFESVMFEVRKRDFVFVSNVRYEIE